MQRNRLVARTGLTVSLLVLAVGCGTLALGLAAKWIGLRYNDSPSMPVGLYIKTSSQSGATLIVFCPEEPFASLSVLRVYRSQGNCPDGAEPLAKPIAAFPGDTVELSGRGIAVNGRLLPNTAPLVEDSAARPLPHWPFGKYAVGADTVWVASSYSPRSFDSRYFGPIKASQVRERVRALLTIR